jgi:hypothetical protein
MIFSLNDAAVPKTQNRMTKVLFSQPVLSFQSCLHGLHVQDPSEQSGVTNQSTAEPSWFRHADRNRSACLNECWLLSDLNP